MNKTELMTQLQETRAALMELLEGLPDEILTEKGVIGDWSIIDILGHLVYWEGQTITLLFQVKMGNLNPATIHFSGEPVDAINQRAYELNRARPLENIWSDFVGIRKQTIRRVSEFSEAELTDASRYAFMNGAPLIELIASNSSEHDEEHRKEIQAWLNQRGAKKNGAAKP